MQDYLPPKYLIESLKLDFKDDILENVMDFDPNIEFWDYPQIIEKKFLNTTDEKWHFNPR